MKKKQTTNSHVSIALLCGGVSSERDVSLLGARVVKESFDPARYKITVYDTATDLPRLCQDAANIDVAFILLHGKGGEDGSIQGLLDLLKIPYQGAGVTGSAVAMDKHLSKVIYRHAGIPTADWVYVTHDEPVSPDAVVKRLGLPLMVKPASQGSSVGMSKVADVSELEAAVSKALACDSACLIEPFLEGRELTGGVLGLDELKTLPIVEICPAEKYTFFDYEAKYQPGATKEICPAQITAEQAIAAQQLASMAHKALGLSGYSRTDIILAKDGSMYVLETNTIPGMTPTSLFPQAAAAAGINFSQLLEMLVQMALKRFSRESELAA